MKNRRWYHRKDTDYFVQVLSPIAATGRILNASDAGLMLGLDGHHEEQEINLGSEIQFIVTTKNPQRLSPRQRIIALVNRIDVNHDTGHVNMAVEVIDAWEDVDSDHLE